ncbi:DNA-binding transcription factor [Lithospermum erythrorhizon]|uniref:DNA-binding transcription factor n=1 Tax=Lithospermum erythrorhizon TaxID=34254 RepID=A0AAV3NVI9_LITER
MQNNFRRTGRIPIEYFPPGVRFHPTDEELITHYLHNKVNSIQFWPCIIGEVELYKYDPWKLPEKALYGDDEWYFFSPRDRKYPNGTRPNRKTGSGYWKATGIDRPILCSAATRIGFKKTLVFYSGKAPCGTKTDWVMTEYRLPDTEMQSPRLNGSMRLDDWVIYRLRLKGNKSNKSCEGQVTSINQVEHLESVTMSVPSPSTGTRVNGALIYDLPNDWNISDTHLANQELPHVEIIPSTPKSTNTSENLNVVYNNGIGKDMFEMDYTLQGLLNDGQGDEIKEYGVFKNVQQHNKIGTPETNNLYQANVASFYDQLLTREDFILSPSDVSANLQEFSTQGISKRFYY